MLRYPVRPWVGPVLVSIFAAFLRFFRLKTPPSLVFDETYYVKQGYSLLELGYEGRWAEDWDDNFAAGDFSGLSAEADYVVHPPVGKWLIAFGKIGRASCRACGQCAVGSAPSSGRRCSVQRRVRS